MSKPCNAVGLENMGIPVVKRLGQEILGYVERVVGTTGNPTPIFFPNQLPEIIDKVFETPSFSPSHPSERHM